MGKLIKYDFMCVCLFVDNRRSGQRGVTSLPLSQTHIHIQPTMQGQKGVNSKLGNRASSLFTARLFFLRVLFNDEDSFVGR